MSNVNAADSAAATLTAPMLAEMRALFTESMETLGASGRYCRLAGLKRTADRCEFLAERIADFLAAIPATEPEEYQHEHEHGGEG